MPLDESNCSASYKVLVLGDHSVGKTALLKSFTGSGFREVIAPTVGVDFVRKILEVDGALIQLIIWDSSGQSRFRSTTKLQYKGVQGLVLVYDVTNRESLKTLMFWLQSIHNEIKPPFDQYEPIPYVICGNKTDLDAQREVTTEQGRKFADKQMAFGFFETSAKTGENVYNAFHTLAFHITDICDPKLMKSYHPNLLRPKMEQETAINQCPKSKKQRKIKAKSKGRSKVKAKSQVHLDPGNISATYQKNGSINGVNGFHGSAIVHSNVATTTNISKASNNKLSKHSKSTCVRNKSPSLCLFTCCFRKKAKGI